jgi:hypothetical protein
MSKSLTWAVLPAAETHKCMSLQDPQGVRAALLEADVAVNGKLLDSNSRTPEQLRILLDMYFHLLQFAKDRCMSPEKASTLVGICEKLVRDCMGQKLLSSDGFKVFEGLMHSHSVHRPPYSAAVFSIEDVKAISDYMLLSFFRHYKLYQYSFCKVDIASVRTEVAGLRNQVPPSLLPPMSKSVPLAQWEAARSEAERIEEERNRKIAEERAAIEAEREREAKASENVAIPSGLRSQLDVIKSTVTKMSAERLDEIEAKLAALEGRVSEMNKPGTVGKAPAKSGRK